MDEIKRTNILAIAADIAYGAGCDYDSFQQHVSSELMQSLLEAYSPKLETEPCSVCYETNNRVFSMECGHWLCRKCARTVANTHVRREWPCPLCRKPCQTPCSGGEADRQSAHNRVHHLVAEAFRNWKNGRTST
jgi:hypothetical protein